MKFGEGLTVGIDLGTTFSSIAQLDEKGEPKTIPNGEGSPITPSVVIFAEGGKVIVGPSPQRVAVEDPKNVVEAIKREMGNPKYDREFFGAKVTPEFLSGLILKKLKQDAESAMGPIANAVITVPYYFNDARRKATQDAGKIAGLNVIDIINEPTAATLTYAWTKGQLGQIGSREKPPERTILVYDLGGGTFDVTVVRYTPTQFRVLATDGDVKLGGIDWNERLAHRVAEEFKRRHGADPLEDPVTRQTLFADCEEAKRTLTDKSQTTVTCRYKGKVVSVGVTRSEFERMTADLLQRTYDTTELVLKQAGIKKGDLDEVILVGGSTFMPRVGEVLRDVTGREPFRGISPTESVGQGAAIHAAILEAKHTGGTGRMAKAVLARLRSVSQIDVNSHSLGIVVRDPASNGRVNHVMIPRNTAIPYSVTQRFETNVENQQRVHVHILEGDARDPDACSLIGDFRVYGLPPNLPAGSPVEITYSFEANGRVTARAKDLTGGREASTEIVRSSGLDDQSLEAFRQLAERYEVE